MLAANVSPNNGLGRVRLPGMTTTPPRLAFWFSLAIALAGALSPVGAQNPTAEQPKPEGKKIDIVFVGNSYTHFHDLPAFVRAIGLAQTPKVAITTTMLAPGGFTLKSHWDAEGDDSPRTVLKTKTPDFVVLQEQSRLPLDNPELMQDSAMKWGKLLKERKLTPVWYMTWARAAEPTTQGRITAQYEKAHKTGGGRLAPVGRAWQAVLSQHKEQQLHVADGSHPNASGTYLAACVLYVTMCGGDVMTFPDRLIVPGDDGKDRMLIDLPNGEGKRLRAGAAKGLRTERN